MNVTEIKIRLPSKASRSFRGSARVVFDDCFVLHGVRIIEANDRLLIAMPSRENRIRCRCGCRYELSARFCPGCGSPIRPSAESSDECGRHHVDVAHPITATFRDYLEAEILSAYRQASAAMASPSSESPSSIAPPDGHTHPSGNASRRT